MVRFLWFLLLVLTSAIILQCAHPVSPSGGAKDVTPPAVIETIPENGSPNFKTDKFTIKFEEFVSLENIQQTALISPPMLNIPDFRVKGKSVVVKFNEDLKPITTYSVYFGDAIVDITEKNPLFNYTYIFSTGDYVDSLSLAGHVYNAFDLAPMEGAYVMLYKDNNDTIVFDSLPYFVVPYYLSKTDVDGRFQFNGLSNDNYLIFAIGDQNSNYIFDQPGEKIAFLDSLIKPIYIEKPKIGTTLNDSITNVLMTNDSIIVTTDSLISDSIYNVSHAIVDLFMFLTPDSTQRLLKAEVVEKNKICFSFSQPSTNIKIQSLKFSPDSIWYVEDFSAEKDTIYWYLFNPPIDSLELVVILFDDTLRTVYLKLDPEKKSSKSRKKDKVEEKEKLEWTSNIKGKKLDLNKHVEIQFNQPYVKVNDIDSSLLIIGKDSIWDPEFNFVDSLHMKIVFPFDLLEETKYHIYFPDSSFSSWNNIHTTAIDLSFSTLPLNDYGILTFKLHPENKQNYILQLLNEDKITLRDFYFNNDTTVTFSYLKPAQYLTKIIYDNNKNNIWDPGNYGQKSQPEKVIYFPKEIKVRANWEIEEDWKW
ncbi:MAG: Ig-like domain-containing protein [Bacteroidetes bacterium]|nr:Ig-like domain-containing protein [Bacteroidota bacterium]MBL6943550.1 Ig-like domain-containing protein [Bacteroidales bacterium]